MIFGAPSREIPKATWRKMPGLARAIAASMVTSFAPARQPLENSEPLQVPREWRQRRRQADTFIRQLAIHERVFGGLHDLRIAQVRHYIALDAVGLDVFSRQPVPFHEKDEPQRLLPGRFRLQTRHQRSQKRRGCS
jgi:hypothetical protein